jgi:hypothetical protein
MKRAKVGDGIALKIIGGMVRAARWAYVWALRLIGVKP